ncbi:hypothetical protein L9F63_000699, partial [Diploptera punctata]
LFPIMLYFLTLFIFYISYYVKFSHFIHILHFILCYFFSLHSLPILYFLSCYIFISYAYTFSLSVEHASISPKCFDLPEAQLSHTNNVSDDAINKAQGVNSAEYRIDTIIIEDANGDENSSRLLKYFRFRISVIGRMFSNDCTSFLTGVVI